LKLLLLLLLPLWKLRLLLPPLLLTLLPQLPLLLLTLLLLLLRLLPSKVRCPAKKPALGPAFFLYFLARMFHKPPFNAEGMPLQPPRANR
jgi:hypothetical protein